MAEHELRIKATLDTSSVQRELDQINKSIMVQNGATGQIQGGGKSGSAQNLALPIRNLQKSIETLNRQLAKIGLQAHDRAREVVSRITGGSAIDTIDAIGPLPRGKVGGPKTAFGQWVRANRYARSDAMPLFMMSSWGSRLGEAFTDAGHENVGGALDFMGDVVGGAAAGSIRGGKWGAAIGALVAAFASAAKSVAKFNKELEKSIQLLGENIEDARQTREDYWKNRVLTNAQDYVREITSSDDGNFTKQYMLRPRLEQAQKAEEMAYDSQQKTLSAIAAAEKALSMLQEELKGVKDKGFIGGMRDKIDRLPSLNDLNDMVFGRKIRPDLLSAEQSNNASASRSKDEITKDIEEVTKNLKTNKELLKQQQSEEAGWKSLRHTIEDAIRRYKQADEKWMKDYEKQQKKSAEQTKKLNDQRENIIREIQADYTQQGVDILSSMGKSGKYMSTMEQASLSQERFSPITKRMDNMQKSLDHLARIDREISKLDTGLKP